MDREQHYLELLRRKARQIAGRSPGMEAIAVREGLAPLDPAAPGAARSEAATLEAIVRWYRPVLGVAEDKFLKPDAAADGGLGGDPNAGASKALIDALEANRARLEPAIRSVGRIELANNAQFPWVGTGWIIGSELGDDIIVTNAHVAREFAERSGDGYRFRPGTPDFSVSQSGNIDFREELAASSAREFPITGIIWISENPALDMALLRVARTAGADRIDPPIRPFADAADGDRMVAVIGYPGSNNGYDPEPFRRLFGAVLGRKRFSPGFLSGMRNLSLTYDCSTLPGSSGSPVIDVATGQAVGLHFAGTAFDTNYAVPAASLARIIAERPWQGEAARPPRPLLADSAGGGGTGAQPPALSVRDPGDGSVRLVVPLEITLRLGAAGAPAPAVSVGGSAPAPRRTDRAGTEAAAARVRENVGADPAVLSIKADYLFRDGRITDDVGVVVGVAPGSSLSPSSYGLPQSVDGVPVSVEDADPETVVAQQLHVIREAFGGRRAGYSRDITEPRFDLSPVTDRMKITLHVSPEAGWPVLRGFLGQPDVDQLTIGMYHMTAPHVVKAIEGIAERSASRITLTLDRQRGDKADRPDDTEGETKKNDIPERDTLKTLETLADDRFRWAPASISGASGLFPSAYHIKVAVWGKRKRDGVSDKAFWLSSGNWQSSNQAPIDRPVDRIGEMTRDEVEGYNREWHAIVEHEGLASTFRNHLEQDFLDNKEASRLESPRGIDPEVLVPQALFERVSRARRFRAFPPEVIDDTVTVQPLLTPDNYPEIVAGLISGAKRRVLIENQSFSLWSDIASTPEHFLKIARAVRERQQAGLDVRIIFRSIFGSEKQTLRQLKAFGILTDSDHLRYFDTCHTKGIVIDDDIAVLGSQNWTAAGTGPNRDASLVIRHPRANAYFARLFDYDWAEMATNEPRVESFLAQPVRIVAGGSESPAPKGYRRISLAEYLGET